MRRIGPFLRDAWSLARPYWSSEERWRARGLLAAIIVLNLSLVGMTVVLTFWQRAFYNALEAKDGAAFTALLFTWQNTEEDGFLPSFTLVATLYIVIAVYALYLRQALEIRWRRWLTEIYLTQWLADRAYYRLALTDPKTDNPDQRISDDARMFVSQSLTLGLGLMRSVVTLGSFVLVLWSLSGPMTIFGVTIPGYMVWVALVYAVVGTAVAHWIGRPLIALNFNQQKVEADFRFALVRFRENVEGIALHGGEADEKRGLSRRFHALMENWWSIMTATKRLMLFSVGYQQVASVFPIVVAAPAYFAGRMPLGGLIQTSSAFGEVQQSLSWFVENYRELTEWRATVERLTGFTRAVAAARATDSGPVATTGSQDGIVIDDLTLSLPDGRTLLEHGSAAIAPGESVVISGASGSGKSTLFRAMAGIWPFGHGRVVMPAQGRRLFLPQRPYIPLGTLKRAVCYPDDEAGFTDAQVAEVLETAELAHLVPRLHDADSWDKRLSGGEQQRLALARALLLKPDWLFLDEATASLDPGAEERLHARLKERLPGTALISIAHRPAVADFHDRRLRVQDKRLAEAG